LDIGNCYCLYPE